MNETKTDDTDSSRKERAEKGRGKGTRVYVGLELLEVLERFQDMGSYGTMREASDELGKLLKKHNVLLQDPENTGQQGHSEKKEEGDGFAGFMGSD